MITTQNIEKLNLYIKLTYQRIISIFVQVFEQNEEINLMQLSGICLTTETY